MDARSFELGSPDPTRGALGAFGVRELAHAVLFGTSPASQGKSRTSSTRPTTRWQSDGWVETVRGPGEDSGIRIARGH